jgi:hypothetical protein
MPSPSIEIAVTGVQNRKILSGLLLSRPAAKNKAKNETARIQNKGEERPSRKPPATAAKPVALVLLMPQRAAISPGPSRATNMAATALMTHRRVVTGSPPGRYAPYSNSERALLGGSCCNIAITLIDPAHVLRAEENGGLAHDPVLGKRLGTLHGHCPTDFTQEVLLYGPSVTFNT